MTHKVHKLQLKCSTAEPAMAAYLFDFLRTQGRACGFVDVESVDVTVEVDLGGLDHTFADFEDLKQRLEQMWVNPEYVYRVTEHDGKGGRRLVRLEEYPPPVPGETVGEEKLREAREALRGQEEANNT